MARNDGVDRTVALNRAMDAGDVNRAQGHNERQNESYGNFDVVLDRMPMNIHFKAPTGDYTDIFDQMVADGIISTRGLKPDATHFCELLLDVNTAYFDNHGGYDFAKQFYADAYKAAVDIVGGEQYILSAVMHADERNRPMSESLGRDVYHYHLHVVYVPVVEKQVLWSKRCKEPALVGTVKETIMQVSCSKKWASAPVLDDQGQPLKTATGKPILKKSYSVLQDDFFHVMRSAGYTDVERGERGSTEEHLSVTQFKVQQEQQRLVNVQAELAQLGDEKEQAIEDTRAAQEKLREIAPMAKAIEQKAVDLIHDVDQHLPEAGALESAKAYREKKALPFIRYMQKVCLALYRKVLEIKSELDALKKERNQEAHGWEVQAQEAQRECEQLRPEAAKFRRLCRLLGDDKVEQMLAVPVPIQNQKHLTTPSGDTR